MHFKIRSYIIIKMKPLFPSYSHHEKTLIKYEHLRLGGVRPKKNSCSQPFPIHFIQIIKKSPFKCLLHFVHLKPTSNTGLFNEVGRDPIFYVEFNPLVIESFSEIIRKLGIDMSLFIFENRWYFHTYSRNGLKNYLCKEK